MSQASDSFKNNYAKLQEIAQKLSNTQEVDIDELVPMVDEATRAYQLCKSRIEAVESALSKRLEKDSDSEDDNQES
ncbi:MAG: exodeoxyribonuclease VII small subunit [Thiomicrorhabdus chilensis]|uniref:exodeoxyribonuclease VII small subunit n=1 Tax=Thiomicrorhabdus chilensis TaxID=63656 RepID=UPI0004165917|nr:exodeoxyribonuclease VII small subunit [Thiomicrorhabdus chilensis]MDX1348184.1 exodeoxyribonuclease VII small subunit [Thiomicrorhabdus chilensis]